MGDAKDANGYDIPNVVDLREINEMRESILRNQFIDREYVDMSSNKYVTLSNMQKFISVESQYIRKLLYQND